VLAQLASAGLGGLLLAPIKGLMADPGPAAEPNPTASSTALASEDAWRDRHTIRIGYRTDAIPFSYDPAALGDHATAASQPTQGTFAAGEINLTSDDGPQGFTIEICKRIVADLNAGIAAGDSEERPRYSIDYVPVTPSSRFARPAGDPARGDSASARKPVGLADDVDMLCGATSVTLQRLRNIDFSLFTFISGAGIMFRSPTGIQRLGDLLGKRVGILIDSSSAAVLESRLTEADLPWKLKIPQEELTFTTDAQENYVLVYGFHTYSQALAAIVPDANAESDGLLLDAIFADREILNALANVAQVGSPGNRARLRVSPLTFSYEPYAIAFPRSNPRLRFHANQTLTCLFRTGQINKLIARAFPSAQQSDLLTALYRIQQIPVELGIPSRPDFCSE
jgi:ABC-type amino acid transport substrate-binding protein